MRSSAFTMMEMLLATLLTVLLMMGVLAVLVQVHPAADARSPSGSLNHQPGQDAWDGSIDVPRLDAWADLLARDLANARRIDATRPGMIAMTGYCAIDGQTYELVHRPVRVVYRVERVDEQAWVIREQTALDVLSNRNVRVDLVCPDVDRFVVVEGTDEQRNNLEPNVAAARAITGVADKHSSNDDPGTGGEGEQQGRSMVGESRKRPPRAILVGGLWFYWEHAPAWAREKELAERGLSNGAGASSDQGDDHADAALSGNQPLGPVNPGRAYRLQVWGDSTEAPIFDRPLGFHDGGGA